MGKTRLALQSAAQLGEEFSDGIYYVPLESLSSADLLATAIADRMQFHIDPASEDGDAESQILQYLSERSILLILDSFEHLIAGASFVSRILTRTDALKLMTTSRERLNLKGEWTYELGGLSRLGGTDPSTEEISGALQLFLERARQADGDFILTEEQKPYAIRICELVEGLPLGIEPAATWVRMLSPKEIVKEIEKGIEFLASTMRDLPDRHRSIQAVYDYSWELLTEEEKQVLKKLSVFEGGFTRRNSERVAGASMATLMSLADKSHLRNPQEGRYAMHALSRQYAFARLQEDPLEEERALSAHAEAYAEMLNKWLIPLKGGQRAEALQMIGEEIENIRAAWDWMVLEGRLDLITPSIEPLWLYYDLRNWFQEGFDTFSKATGALKNLKLQKKGPDKDNCIAKLLTRQAWHAWRLGRYDEADVHIRRALELQIDGDLPEQALNKHISGIIAYSQGNLDRAKENLSEGLDLWRESKEPWGEAMTLFYLSLVNHARGEYGDAQQPYQRGVDLFRDVGYQFGATFSHTSLGNVVRTLGDFMEAKKLCMASLKIRREMDDPWGIAACLDSLGVVESGLGELDEAMKAGLESLEIRTSLGDKRGMGTSLNNLGHITYLRQEFSQAKRYGEEGLQIRRDLGNRKGMAASLNFLGTVALAMDDLPAAKEYVNESLSIRSELGEKVGIIDSQNNLGKIALAMDDAEDAQTHFQSSIKNAWEIGAFPMALEAIIGIAQYKATQGELENAATMLALVANHRSTSGDTKNRAQELFRALSEDSSAPALEEAWKSGASMDLDGLVRQVLET
jgi:predicted ATPase